MNVFLEHKRFIIFTAIGLLVVAFITFPMFVNLSGWTLKNKIAELKSKGYAVSVKDMERIYAPIPDNPADVFYTFQPYIDANQADFKPMHVYNGMIIRNYPDSVLSLIKDAMKKHEAFLNTVYDTAENHRSIRFARNWNLGFFLPLPELNTVRILARATATSAYISGMNGDREDVMRKINTLSTLANWQAEDPILISRLVAIAIMRIQIGVIEESVRKGFLSTDDLVKLMELLDWHSDMICDKRFIQYEITSTIMMGSGDLENLLFDYPAPPLGVKELTMKFRIVIHHLFFMSSDKICALNHSQLLGESDPLDYCKSITPVKESADSLRKLPSFYFFTRNIIPDTENIIARFSYHIALSRCAKAGIAVELFRRKYGKLPDKLSELVPEFLPSVPVDPFDMKELRYIKGELDFVFTDALEPSIPTAGSGMFSRTATSSGKNYPTKEEIVKANGFRVYSIGKNLKDDGGKPQSESCRETDCDTTFSIILK